jgi:hypothetical protein
MREQGETVIKSGECYVIDPNDYDSFDFFCHEPTRLKLAFKRTPTGDLTAVEVFVLPYRDPDYDGPAV